MIQTPTKVFLLAILFLLAGSSFCHADYLYTIQSTTGNFVTAIIDPASGQEYSGMAPIGSIFRIKESKETTFKYWRLTNTAKANPPLKIVAKNKSSGEEKTIILSNCSIGVAWGSTICGSNAYCTLCISNKPPIDINYLFTSIGEYEVTLWYSQNFYPPYNWLSAGNPTNITIIDALASVSGPKKAVLSPNQTTYVVPWSITNHSFNRIIVQDAVPIGCRIGISCSINETLPLALAPGESLILTQTITLSPTTGFEDFDTTLQVTYSEGSEKALLSKKAYSQPMLAEFARQENQKFGVKIIGGETRQCIGRQGIGITGAAALPKTKLSWLWNSIEYNECDSTNQNYVYCDAVQFAIMVSKRIQRIEALLLQQEENPQIDRSQEIVRLTDFSAYLLSDGYSRDFQRDFSEYYSSQAFAEVSEWFKGNNTGFLNKIFSDHSRTKFYYKQSASSEKQQLNTQAIANPIPAGLYEVALRISRDNVLEPRMVKSSGEPNAAMEVILTKKRDPPTYNPFYYIAFDGEIGKNGTRIGYGAAYSGQEMMLVGGTSSGKVERVTLSQTQENSNPVALKITKVSDFDTTNSSELLRGSILFLYNAGNERSFELKYLPTTPTPIFAKIAPASTGASANAFAYYYLTDDTMGAESQYFSKTPNPWSGQASTISNCKAFDGTPLDRSDSSAPREVIVLPECSEARLARVQPYGFYWPNVSTTRDFIYLKTVFFVPESKQYYLHNYCSSSQPEYYSPIVSIAPGQQGTAIPLNYGLEFAPKSITQVFDLVRQQKACVYLNETEQSIDFFWNEEKLFEDIESRKLSQGHEAIINKCS